MNLFVISAYQYTSKSLNPKCKVSCKITKISSEVFLQDLFDMNPLAVLNIFLSQRYIAQLYIYKM